MKTRPNFRTYKPAPEKPAAVLPDTPMPLGKCNFIGMAIAGAMIVAGFLLMLGSTSGTDGVFNPDIFSVRRIVVGPAVAFLGFVAMALAIILKPKKTSVEGSQS